MFTAGSFLDIQVHLKRKCLETKKKKNMHIVETGAQGEQIVFKEIKNAYLWCGCLLKTDGWSEVYKNI